MSIIVEDGTAKSDAESYCTVAEATTYFSNIGNTAWAALTSDAVREQNLRKATTFMLGRYRSRWEGYRKTTTQALDWPRSLVPIKDAPDLYGGSASYYDDSSVPQAVKNACASLALRASTATLLADQTRTKKSVTIGPITTVYDDVAGQATIYAEVDAMLAPYLKSSGNQVEMVRR